MGSSYSHSHNQVNPIKRVFALGIIDVQNDFLKGGSLAVTDANDIIAPINKLRFTYLYEMETFITMDYHPHNHMSFAKTHNNEPFTNVKLNLLMPNENKLTEINQTLWPVHCVKDTIGSNLHQDLIVTKKDIIVHKGTLEKVESYSGFGDAFKGKYENTNLDRLLEEKHVTDIVLTGIACDYCVYYTALDALRLGYKIHLIISCTKGVSEDTTKIALNDMKVRGVNIYENVNDFYDYYEKNRNTYK